MLDCDYKLGIIPYLFNDDSGVYLYRIDRGESGGSHSLYLNYNIAKYSEKDTMLKVLLVEDNDTFRKVFLESLIHRFPDNLYEEVKDGNEVFSRVSEFYPDIIFMDINLPNKNGLELTSEIKKEYPGISIIIITNYDFPEYRTKAEEIGADYFISKSSVTEEKIASLIGKLAENN
jgi:CheY-like chemotaxis protein